MVVEQVDQSVVGQLSVPGDHDLGLDGQVGRVRRAGIRREAGGAAVGGGSPGGAAEYDQLAVVVIEDAKREVGLLFEFDDGADARRHRRSGRPSAC